MKARILPALALAACLVLGGPFALSVAGPAKKCSYDTQTCLDLMVRKLQNQAWLGIEYNDTPGPDYMRLSRVVPGSPAESAGFLAGDQIISVNGARYADNSEDACVTCSKLKTIWEVGAKIDYVVLRGGEEIHLEPTLATLPSDVMAMMIGMHMIEHANPVVESGKP